MDSPLISQDYRFIPPRASRVTKPIILLSFPPLVEVVV